MAREIKMYDVVTLLHVQPARQAALSQSRIEATTETCEDEDGHVRIYPPAGMREEERAEIEGNFADRCVDILVERGVLICSAVYN